MKRYLEIALGVLTAIGGFMEIGEIVATSLIGARFGLTLAWVVPVAVVGIILFAEMSGRVATVSRRPVFDVVRERMGPSLGLFNLIAAFVITMATAAAEIGGVALALQLATSVHPLLWVPLVGFLVWLVIWLVSFKWMENATALLGLLLLVTVVALWKLSPGWGELGREALSPSIPSGEGPATYWYFAVALLGAAFMPYEVFFFSSGAVEEGWSPRDVVVEKANAVIGFAVGGVLAFTFMALAAIVFEPRGVEVEHLSQVALPTTLALGKIGLAIIIIGFVGATFGAALETSLSCGYMVAQYFGWQWGKFVRPVQGARFHLVVLLTVAGSIALMLVAGDAVKLTEYVIVLSAIALPLTYFPVLIVANDRGYMGEKANSGLINAIGTVYFILLVVASVAGLVLMIVTKAGS